MHNPSGHNISYGTACVLVLIPTIGKPQTYDEAHWNQVYKMPAGWICTQPRRDYDTRRDSKDKAEATYKIPE
jgi:hypothetical protein